MSKAKQLIELKSEDAKEALRLTLEVAEGKIDLPTVMSIWKDICSPEHPTAPLQKRFSGEMLEEIRVNILNQLIKDLLRNPLITLKTTIIAREIRDIPQRENRKIVPNSFHQSVSMLVYLTDENKLAVINTTKEVKDIEPFMELNGNVEFDVKIRTSLDADLPQLIYDESSKFRPLKTKAQDPIKLFKEGVKNIGKRIMSIVDILQAYEDQKKVDYNDFEVMRLNVDFSKPIDKDKFKGSVLSVSDLSTNPENKMHRTTLIGTYEDAYLYGRHSQIYAMVHPSVETEGQYLGITLNHEFIIPIAAIENNVKPITKVPEDAVDASEELYEEVEDDTPAEKADTDCPYFGIGYDPEDEGCQECDLQKECKEKSQEV